MPRPPKKRKVGFTPRFFFFTPSEEKPESSAGEVILTHDELEAIRLADYEGFYQEDAARFMGISRQTFGRILDSAHGKIGEALVEGKTISIEGGVVTMREETYACQKCGFRWGFSGGEDGAIHCPRCGCGAVSTDPQERGWGRRRCGHGRRRRNRHGW